MQSSLRRASVCCADSLHGLATNASSATRFAAARSDFSRCSLLIPWLARLTYRRSAASARATARPARQARQLQRLVGVAHPTVHSSTSLRCLVKKFEHHIVFCLAPTWSVISYDLD